MNLCNIEEIEPISSLVQNINDVKISTLSFEKFFMRAANYCSVTVVLTEYGQNQTAYIVASGGGNGGVNFSHGANRKFATECAEVLESFGFTVKESNLNTKGKGFIERFLR